MARGDCWFGIECSRQWSGCSKWTCNNKHGRYGRAPGFGLSNNNNPNPLKQFNKWYYCFSYGCDIDSEDHICSWDMSRPNPSITRVNVHLFHGASIYGSQKQSYLYNLNIPSRTLDLLWQQGTKNCISTMIWPLNQCQPPPQKSNCTQINKLLDTADGGAATATAVAAADDDDHNDCYDEPVAQSKSAQDVNQVMNIKNQIPTDHGILTWELLDTFFFPMH